MDNEYSSSVDAAQREVAAPALIDGFAVHPDGRVEPVTDPVGTETPEGGFVWLHFHLDTGHDVIEHELGLDPLVSRSLLAPETRPRCRRIGTGTLINLRGANLNEGESPEDMLSLRCWLDGSRLITVRKRKSQAIETLRQDYKAGRAHPRPGALMLDIVRRLLDRIDPIADGLADGLDPLERRSQEHGEDDALRQTISAMRHDAVIFRRYLAPMRDAIAKLSAPEGGLAQDDVTAAQEEADRATRIVEELEISIDRASVIVDQMNAARSERMNGNMMVLSVVSAIFLPLSFLTGLLGINVGGLPGTDDPRAFTVVVAVCLFLGVLAGAFFKARDWI